MDYNRKPRNTFNNLKHTARRLKRQNIVLTVMLAVMGLGLIAVGGTALDLYQETFRWRQFMRKSCETISTYKYNTINCTASVDMMDAVLRENGVDFTVKTVMGK